MNLLRVHAPITDDQFNTLDAEARLNWEKIRTGIGGSSEWNMLAEICNLCSMRAQSISNGEVLIDMCLRAAVSLQKMKERADDTGVFGVCHLSLASIPDLLDFHSELLRNSTPAQMMDALRDAKEKHEQI